MQSRAQERATWVLCTLARMAIKGVDSAIFESQDMLCALATRDIGAVYRILVAHGVSQRYLAELVGQSQSEPWVCLTVTTTRGRRFMTR